jgi:hypothetical protein
LVSFSLTFSQWLCSSVNIVQPHDVHSVDFHLRLGHHDQSV